MEIKLTPVQKSDLEQIKDIYNYYVSTSTATFHIGEVTAKELEETIYINHPLYLSDLIFFNNELCGYIYVGPYKKREAYLRTAEITIYLKPECIGKGIAKIAILEFEQKLKKNGLKVLLSVISGENTSSIKLFGALGYEHCAHFKQVGEKFGRILDVIVMQKMI